MHVDDTLCEEQTFVFLTLFLSIDNIWIIVVIAFEICMLSNQRNRNSASILSSIIG